MKKIIQGFTLVEVLVVIVIIGILAGISVGTIPRLLNESSFNEATQLIFDSLSSTKSNAFSARKCGNELSEKWTFALDKEEEGIKGFKIKCVSDDDPDDPDDPEIITDETNLLDNDNWEISIFETKEDDEIENTNTEIEVSFFSDELVSRINDDWGISDLKITMKYIPNENINKSVCFNRISGIVDWC